MYWQVYLHKTVLVAEQMLIKALERAKELAMSGIEFNLPQSLSFFLYKNYSFNNFKKINSLLDHFARLDDYDIFGALKYFMQYDDPVLSYLSSCLIDRHLFKIKMSDKPFSKKYIADIKRAIKKRNILPKENLDYLVFNGEETNPRLQHF